MHLTPISLNLQGRQCLVVGASQNAIGHAQKLISLGAVVTLIGDLKPDGLDGLKTWEPRSFQEEDLHNFWLIVAASDNDVDNSKILGLCNASCRLCVSISDKERSSFQFPESDQYPNGDSPDGPINTPEIPQPTSSLEVFSDTAASDSELNGFVSLVGAGPGDPELLTLRAMRLIQSADVLVYDRLVSGAILKFRRPDATLLYAGKAKANHSMPQGSINQLLVDLALKGNNVVRLKGGDPFIFGRGGEEIETLAEYRIPFQVVPGITAASGCSSFSGIPLTHRDHAQSCVFLTGHLKNGEINLNWQDLRDPNQTIVIYMGLTGLRQICDKLIENGRSPDTPAALIERGTTSVQRVHVGSLHQFAEQVQNEDVRPPTLLIIGSVVNLHKKLNWFDPDRQKTVSGYTPFSGPDNA